MWAEYKKRFWMTQVVILVAVLAAWQVLKMPVQQLVAIALAMEIGGVLGAWMGARLKRQIEKSDDELPLKR